ncbi:MAG TPA: hypothetical protein VMF62_15440 [Acetobacteraceae bacterium]|jgi:hypothetical protein|nr:hypothetical protein [Acetobacteraceae bacterium]
MTSDEPASPLGPELFALRRALFARDEQAAALARRLEAAEEELRTLRAALARLEQDGFARARPSRSSHLFSRVIHASGSPTSGDHALAAAVPLPAPQPSRLSRRALRALWRLVRPIARPIAWRTRSFLFEPTRQALADLQAAETRLAEAVEALTRTLSASGPIAERVAGIAGTIEAALLTVALSPSPACDPPTERDDPAPAAVHPS